MNFSFYVFGNPDGYDQYPLDSNSTRFRNELTSCRTESRMSVFRNVQLMQYCYVRKVPGDNGLFLGFTLVVTGVYCLNCHTLNGLFEDTFYDVLLKGELLRFQKNKYNYIVSKFADKADETKRIYQFFKMKLDSELNSVFVPIPTSFKIGKGEYTLSLKESASNINDVISQYDIVHLTNDEKSISELERTQRMLSELYSKHQQLEAQYKKVLNQKRNFKVVVLLSLILLGCVTGFWLLNDVLIDKNARIKNLEDSVAYRDSQINSLNSTNNTLQSTIESLKDDITEKEDSIQQLRNECDALQTTIYDLQEDNNSLRRDLRLAKTAIGEIYEVYGFHKNYADLYYRKYNSDGTYGYYQSGAHYNDYTPVTVYYKQDGYALTSAGYLKMEDIRKR